MRAEIERIRGVADMLCTGHAGLSDRFARRALVLDIAVLALTGWLVALAFIEPRLNFSLTPFGLDPQLWIGLLATGAFLLTIVQITMNWKGRSDAHKHAMGIYAGVKREAGYLLVSDSEPDQDACARVLARYDIASGSTVSIPEREFLRQKRRHRSKVELSRFLDSHPSASIHLTRIKFWIRDNFQDGGKS